MNKSQSQETIVVQNLFSPTFRCALGSLARLETREAGAWDSMECLHLVRPLLEQQTQRNQERAEITTGMQQLRQLWTRRYKRATNRHFGGFGCRSKDCSWSLHKVPPRGTQTTQSFPPARPTTHPRSPTLLPFKEHARVPVSCSCSLVLQHGSQENLAWISCLASIDSRVQGPGLKDTLLSKRWSIWCSYTSERGRGRSRGTWGKCYLCSLIQHSPGLGYSLWGIQVPALERPPRKHKCN